MSSYAGARVRPELLDMTSVADGRTHTITSAEFERGVLEGLGLYRAVCATEVVTASLVACPGARCPRCAEHCRESRRVSTPPGLLVRLVHRARGLRPEHDL